MKNSDFIKCVIRCRNCIHRRTWKCFMNQYNPDLDEYYGMTDDEGFCHLGERDEEAELRHNEDNNFLTSVMEDLYHNLND